MTDKDVFEVWLECVKHLEPNLAIAFDAGMYHSREEAEAYIDWRDSVADAKPFDAFSAGVAYGRKRAAIEAEALRVAAEKNEVAP